MILRVLLVLLLAGALVAVLGRWRRRVPPKPRTPAVESARKCPRCGSYLLEGTTCACPPD